MNLPSRVAVRRLDYCRKFCNRLWLCTPVAATWDGPDVL